MKEKIDVIRKIDVEFNVNPAEKYDLVLVSEFVDLTDLETYVKHPEHLKVSELIVNNRVERACVDYEVN